GSKRRANSPAKESEDGSELEVQPPSKRVKQDISEFGWAAESFIKNSVLSEKHKAVIRKVDNYSADLDVAIKSIEKSSCNPSFPRKLWRAVLEDQYIELNEVNALVSTLQVHDAGRTSVPNALADALELTTLAKRAPSKEITGERAWRWAWQLAAEAITFAFPFRRKELIEYEQHIMGLFNTQHVSVHKNILQYDKAIRQLMGSRRDLLYDDFEQRDFAKYRSAFLTSSGSHTGISTGSASPQRSPRPRDRSKEICKKFNRGECDAFSGCERKHICANCRKSGHGASSCKDKGESKGGKTN
ncbi:hypothetical protein GYMLUDRAFT_166782, partial [Collybiopsis luxurians FD-317 M1]